MPNEINLDWVRQRVKELIASNEADLDLFEQEKNNDDPVATANWWGAYGAADELYVIDSYLDVRNWKNGEYID